MSLTILKMSEVGSSFYFLLCYNDHSSIADDGRRWVFLFNFLHTICLLSSDSDCNPLEAEPLGNIKIDPRMKHSVKKKTSSLDVDNDNDEEPANAPATPRPGSNSFLLFAVGFFACMIIMELALEGANNAFPDLQALPYAITLFQFGCCFFLPLVVSRGKSLVSFPKTPKEYVPYISLSVFVFGSTCLSTMAVRYVEYPTKVVFKSAKLIPTMIVATFLQRGSKYGVLDYLAAMLLCAGAAGYSWGGGSPPGKSGETSTSYTGVSLLLVSVFCDSFTPNIQQRLMTPPSTALSTKTIASASAYTTPSVLSQLSSLFLPSEGGGLGLSASALMTNANGVGCIGLLLFMTANGSLLEAVAAAMTHPFLLIYLTVVGLSLSTAVLCYTKLIQESGSVMAVAVSTLRKVATIVLSYRYIVYPKAVSMIHVVSGFLVVGGILLSSYSKDRSKSSENGRQ
jgi:drug/metabolite transporter (DMT)-like permease